MPQQNDEPADHDASWEQRAAIGCFEAIPAPFRWRQSARFAHLLNGYRQGMAVPVASHAFPSTEEKADGE